jgi:hypothetical protein
MLKKSSSPSRGTIPRAFFRLSSKHIESDAKTTNPFLANSSPKAYKGLPAIPHTSLSLNDARCYAGDLLVLQDYY